jgi:hypothetical protein
MAAGGMVVRALGDAVCGVIFRRRGSVVEPVTIHFARNLAAKILLPSQCRVRVACTCGSNRSSDAACGAGLTGQFQADGRSALWSGIDNQ